jgi:hypothetical protein
MEFIFLTRPSLLVVPVMLLMSVIESAGPQASDCSDASAFAGAGESVTGRANAHPPKHAKTFVACRVVGRAAVRDSGAKLRYNPSPCASPIYSTTATRQLAKYQTCGLNSTLSGAVRDDAWDNRISRPENLSVKRALKFRNKNKHMVEKSQPTPRLCEGCWPYDGY